MKIQRKIDKYVVVAFEIKGDRIGISCGEGVCDSMDATELFREWEPATVENIAKSVWRPPKPTVEPAFTVEEVKHICDLTDDGFDVDDAMNKILKQPESVKHTSCDGCVHKGINFFMCGGCFCHTETMSNQERSNWTPKQPEPVAPVKEFNSDLTLAEARIEQLEKAVKEIIAECYSCQHTTYWKVLDIIKEVVGETGSPKEPKAEPGLVSYEIFKFHDEWTVKHPDYVNKLALNQAVGRTDFLRIDCKNGGRYYSLIAFANENPPVKCWFRETK